MKKVLELLKGTVVGRFGIGVLAFVLAYTSSGGGTCPFCGNQGLHPWEWGVVVGV